MCDALQPQGRNRLRHAARCLTLRLQFRGVEDIGLANFDFSAFKNGLVEMRSSVECARTFRSECLDDKRRKVRRGARDFADYRIEVCNSPRDVQMPSKSEQFKRE